MVADNSSFNLPFVVSGQVNLQKSGVPTSSLMHFLHEFRLAPPQGSSASKIAPEFILGIQEPDTSPHTKVRGLDRRQHLFFDQSAATVRAALFASKSLAMWPVPAFTDGDMATALWKTRRPGLEESAATVRAALFASKSLAMWPVPAFTDGDMATALWKTRRPGLEEVYVASVYLDITAKKIVWPLRLVRLVEHCNNSNSQLLLLMDANSHSPWWGSPEANDRGKIMEELILVHNLAVLNTGSKPTFRNRNTPGTHPDVSLATPTLSDLVSNWRVSDGVVGSDHQMILFHIDLKSAKPPKRRNFHRGDWDTFQSRINDWPRKEPQLWSVPILEEEAQAFTSKLTKVLNTTHPLRRQRHSVSSQKWWSGELNSLHHTMTRLQKTFYKKRSDESHERFKEARRAFKKASRQAKRKSWKSFTEDSTDPKKVAQLIKVVQHQANKSLGLLHDDQGQTLTPEGSMNLLADTHFPGCLPRPLIRPLEPPPAWPLRDIDHPDVSFITAERVTNAVHSFNGYKAPGPDGIPAIVYQKLDDAALSRLTNIFKASVILGYTPAAWRQSNVIYIPKPGKPDYGVARAFRPITLINVVFKFLERVIYWHLQTSVFSTHPLHRNQFGFRKGRSTESALSKLTGIIESAFQNKQFAIGVFLDIQGAFDNARPENILEGLKAKSVPEFLVDWYKHYLCNRSMTASHGGVTIARRFDEGLVHCIGFADDGALVISGPKLHVLASRMQRAINAATDWGALQSLTFSTAKTTAMLFHRKVVPTHPPPLMINGTAVPWSSEVKYLGLTLDPGLTWHLHVTRRTQKARGILIKYRNAIGKIWGSPPKMSKWAYTGVVRPMVSYGCLVWAHAVDRTYTKAALTKLNRLALLSLGHFRRSTPTAGLEVMTLTLPLPLFIKQTAAIAHKRTELMCSNTHYALRPRHSFGHRQVSASFLTNIGFDDFESDSIPTVQSWDRQFVVELCSFASGKPVQEGDLHLFTDGSRLNNASGSGFVALDSKTRKELVSQHFHLKQATVAQCETHAIKRAAHWLASLPGHRSIILFSDSQSTIRALANPMVNSSLLLNTIEALNEAGRHHTVRIRWIKAHAGHDGNELADSLAKQGAADPSKEVTDIPYTPWNLVKSNIQSLVLEYWDSSWSQLTTCRQTKQWFPKIDKAKSKSLLDLGRREISACTQLITGHNFMRRHEAIVAQYDTQEFSEYAECRLCMEDEETSFHIVAECPALQHIRTECFNTLFLPEPVGDWTVAKLLRFLRISPVSNCFGLAVEGELDPSHPW
ncbi:Retrovirus-related Pol poly from type-1 retrotransposable element R1 [Paramuricea clavata]|uniref:Retrovirus-related Pol poly from type-1 retrotransposable element R1 n=1 Tax=Paramuricea clavata TaxID=317549 RepID=A0A6S7K6Q9_PARCT|nr:Retrovirus-related Pol poly from type-1 retrotransposable element R1 [Paramuricea clavata]